MTTKRGWTVLFCALVLLVIAAPTHAGEYNIAFISHGAEGDPFWATVYRGFQDALERFDLDGTMFRPTREGDLNFHVSTFRAAIARGVDGIITTIPDEKALDEVVAEAIEAGIPVIAVNSDDPEGAAGNARLAFIGQSLEVAGYVLAKTALDDLGMTEDIHALIGVSAPGLVWAEQRASGIQRALEEAGARIDRVDLTEDKATQVRRLTGYLGANPDVDVMLFVATEGAAASIALQQLGYEPGEVLVGGFDLTPDVLAEMESGYVQLTIDQQPYLQGYLPVVELYLNLKYGFSAWDADTGTGIVRPEDVPQVKDLAESYIR